MRYRFTRDEINIKRGSQGNWILSIMLDGQLVERNFIGYKKEEAIRKFQHEYGVYPNDYKPEGILTLCNFGGLAVMKIEDGIETFAYVCDNYGDGYKNLTKSVIRYNAKGDPYFIRNRKRYYLSEFMRV